MFVDSDGPSQEAFQYISERGFLVPEEKFISEEVFLTDEFNPTIDFLIEQIFKEMGKKFCVLNVNYLKNGTRRKAIYTYIDEHYKDLTGFSSEEKKYLIICYKEEEQALREKLPQLKKCFQHYFEQITYNSLDYLKSKEELQIQLDEDEKEEELKNRIIQLPKITKCFINNVTDNSAKIEIEEIKKEIIINKNTTTKITFGREFKDAKIAYLLFFFNSEKNKYETIEKYELKNNKVAFQIDNLKPNHCYTFKISCKFDRFISLPEINFYFYTRSFKDSLSSLYVYGINNYNSLMVSPTEEDMTDNPTDKDNIIPFVDPPQKWCVNVSHFSFFGSQTLTIIPDGKVINSGKFYYDNERQSSNIEYDTITNSNIQLSYSSSPYEIEFPSQYLRKVGVGDKHCVALNNVGECYSWGENLTGQLGQGLDKMYLVGIPKKIDFSYEGKKNVFITDIQVGSYHNLALGICQGKRLLYCWGLGRGVDAAPGFAMPCSSSPLLIPFENCENIVKIYSRYHTNSIICWDKNKNLNVLYNFGLNLHYQLGFYNNLVDQQKNWDLPTKVDFFEKNNLNVLDIKYSESYSVVLVENQEHKQEIYFSGVVPHKKGVYKMYTKENFDFVNDIINFALGKYEVFFLLKSRIIKKLEKDQKLTDITFSKEQINTIDFETKSKIQIEAMENNFVLMIGNKNK